MKKWKNWLLPIFTCLVVLCAVLLLTGNTAPAMAAKVTQADIDALKNDASNLDKQQKEIQSKLSDLKDDKAAAVQKKSLLDDQIANTAAKISNTESQISDYNTLITQAEAELADAQQREEAQYELFCKRVREMEEQGTVSYWSVLFKAASFSDLLGRLDIVNEIMDYDRQVIQDLQALQAEIEEKKTGLEASKADLVSVKAELETQKKQLSAQREEATKLVKEIDDNAAEYQATLDELEAIAAAKGIDMSKVDASTVHGSPAAASARFSTLQDLEAGRHTEIDMFSGALMRMGRELGIPTPYNDYTYHMIKALEEKNDGRFTYDGSEPLCWSK